jgi:CubicO group peptidase (beta-lactamase class C family)
MNDTDFFVPKEKAHRLAACYSAGVQIGMTAGEAKLTLQDDPATSSFLSPPSFISGGGGLCSTAADYLTFCRRCSMAANSTASAARPEDAEADGVEPFARRRRPAGDVALAVLRSSLQWHRLRSRASPSP